MNKPEAVLKIFEKYVPIVNEEMKDLVRARENHQMYRMVEYILGYCDENFKGINDYSGKRFRSGACLLLADYYGVLEKAVPVAASIEIFHNFTLVHDDIEDNDSLRRGRPTVWKLWGVNQAINTGDAQFALSYLELLKYLSNNPKEGPKIQELLYNNYLAVAEGQHMDLRMAEEKIDSDYVNIDNYMDMIYRKSATLVAVSTMAAGTIAGKPDKECKALWDYGLNLGLAYQLSDDLISIWGKAENTGKTESKDLIERKKTLPVIYLYSKLSGDQKKKFASLYDKEGELKADEVSQIKLMLSEDKAHDYVWEVMKKHIKLSDKAIDRLSLTDQQKKMLNNINRALIPNMKWWDA